MLTHVLSVNVQSAWLAGHGFVAREHEFFCTLVPSSRVISSRYLLVIELIQHAPLPYRLWASHSELIDFGICEVQRVNLALSVMANRGRRPRLKQMHCS